MRLQTIWRAGVALRGWPFRSALALLAGRRAVSWPEAAVVSAALLLPMVLHLTSRFFWTGPLVQVALLVVCIVRARRVEECSFLKKRTKKLSNI